MGRSSSFEHAPPSIPPPRRCRSAFSHDKGGLVHWSLPMAMEWGLGRRLRQAEALPPISDRLNRVFRSCSAHPWTDARFGGRATRPNRCRWVRVCMHARTCVISMCAMCIMYMHTGTGKPRWDTGSCCLCNVQFLQFAVCSWLMSLDAQPVSGGRASLQGLASDQLDQLDQV